jgi:hypothetical protein
MMLRSIVHFPCRAVRQPAFQLGQRQVEPLAEDRAKNAKTPSGEDGEGAGIPGSRRLRDGFLSLPVGVLAVSARGWIQAVLSGVVLAFMASGCGYSTVGSEPVGGYQWHSLYPEDVKTIAVPIFTNKSFRRDEEFRLTKALVTQIEAKTQYKVVPRERADTVLEGEITSINVERVSDDAETAVPQENLYRVIVDFTWKDQRTGRIRVSRQNFEQDSTFYPTLGEGEFVGSQEAAEKLASGIVDQLQADW